MRFFLRFFQILGFIDHFFDHIWNIWVFMDFLAFFFIFAFFCGFFFGFFLMFELFWIFGLVLVLFPEYKNIRIFVRKRCCIQIPSDIHSVHYVASKYIRIFVHIHFMIFAHHCTEHIVQNSTIQQNTV